MKQTVLIQSALTNWETLPQLSALEWDLLIRQGRRANLLARLGNTLSQKGWIDAVPRLPRTHMDCALRMVERQSVALRWEVECIKKALADSAAPIILLKGAAYVMAGLPAADGRVFSDVDILVPHDRLEEVEQDLRVHGWRSLNSDPYDQRYYRQWMHEIPPMRHVRRGTVIDVHHAILPETARIKVNTPALFAAARPLPGHDGRLFVLQPVDMLLHSATHLFHEGELGNGLRDLFDLDSLLRHFGQIPGFWRELVPRALELGLTRPLYYALRYTTEKLSTPVPSAVVADARSAGGPSMLVGAVMDFSYRRALLPAHSSCDTPGTALARFLLYVRSHWIRMPFPLLAYHLGRKALLRPRESRNPQENQPVAGDQA